MRHLEPRAALARIHVLALRPLAPGDELLPTYIDPSLPLAARRTELAQWGFGECACARCVSEAAEAAAAGGAEPVEGAGEGMADLEVELKAGLGVV